MVLGLTFTSADKHFYQHNILGLIFSALLLVFIYPATGIDASLLSPYFDAEAMRFPYKHHYVFEKVMHAYLKFFLIFIALCTLFLALGLNKIKPFRDYLGAYQKQFCAVFVGMLLSTTVVAFLKSMSVHGCPNDLLMYGGKLPLLALFADLPQGVAPGHCFPGGHASGGFALMAFYFGFRQQKPKFAYTMLLISILLGFVMGWAQMMRGEHFLSHNLWSAWWVWLVCLLNPVLLFTNKMNEK